MTTPTPEAIRRVADRLAAQESAVIAAGARELHPEAPEWGEYEDAWQYATVEVAARELIAWRADGRDVELVCTLTDEGTREYGIAFRAIAD